MNTYTDTQLKQALAKMLPDKITHSLPADKNNLYYIPKKGADVHYKFVLDTELLHLCWLVEEELTQNQCNQYSQELRNAQMIYEPTPLGWFFHATWQQRVIALAKVKGVEL